jgi:hypothetical protein
MGVVDAAKYCVAPLPDTIFVKRKFLFHGEAR